MTTTTTRPGRLSTVDRSRQASRWGWTVALAVMLGWAVNGTGVSIAAMVQGRQGALALMQGFLSPDLTREFLGDVAAALIETVQISLTGLLFAALLGLPLAALIAGNVHAPRPLRSAARTLAAMLRGVPDLLWALLFVATVGPGPAAGALALAVHGAGQLAKLCAEQMEAVDPAPVEALRLTGAGRVTTAALAVIPQAAPGLASLLLYQAECLLRTSTVLGFVGAGGIGQQLAISLKLFRYNELSTLILAVLATILVVDMISRVIRRRLGATV